MTSRNVHLVGSVPMPDARTVFETVSAALGPRLRWIPDGETGARLDWVMSFEPLFASHPALELSPEEFQLHAKTSKNRRYRLKPGRTLADLTFDNLGYADVARDSYAVFSDLKRQGTVSDQAKFMITMAPAHSVIWLFLDDSLHAAADPIYNAAVKREIDKIAASLPHDQIAIQFDVASAVFARLERNEPSGYGRTKVEMQETFTNILIDLGDHVPAGIDLLYHLCYGDKDHKHVVEPTDMSDMVEFTNRLMRGITRPVQLVHMPVPRDRADDAYFAPLRRLQLRPETELCLGLVHYTDGFDGTRRRLATAERFVKDFSIATECGLGRRDPATIPQAAADSRPGGGVAIGSESRGSASGMGEIVAGFGVSHSPHAPEEVRKTGADHPLLPLYARVSEAIEATKPDVLIVFDCDHFSTFFLDNWPIFAIGVADHIAGPNDGTVMPRYELKGHPELAAHIHRHCVASGFDLALLQDFEVDHSIVVPLHFIPPTQSIPIVPIFINGFVPPLPSSHRCHALGRSVRAAVESFPQPLRIGVMASGQFSLEIGGPKVAPGRRQGVPDPEWGARVTELLRAGDNATLVAEATFPRLQKAGNIGGELLNWIALLGAVDDRKVSWIASQYDHADGFAVWQWSSQ